MTSIREEIKKINRRLVKRFGIPPRSEYPPDPVDMLIATILSQNTNDKNSYKAFSNLKAKYKTWEEVSRLSTVQIEQEIKTAGLGKQKSKAIKAFLLSVIGKSGKASLDYIVNEPDEKIIAGLKSFSGVGVKTASCVLLFALRKNVCPVDTHVHRIVNRVGLAAASSPDKTFYKLNEFMPHGIAHQFHTNLIRLGREICKPARPSCAVCPLLKICRYDNKNMLPPRAAVVKNDFMLLDNVS